MFRAVNAISAERRWCLTGTPIQNKLEDLYSLFLFLRTKIFEDKAQFQKHIVDLMKVDHAQGLQNLRLLLASCCLRRQNTVLPSRCDIQEEVRVLELSQAERQAYDDITTLCNKNIQRLVNNNSSSKVFMSIIQLITRLRLACNNGAVAAGLNDNDKTPEILDPDAVLDSFERMDNNFCTDCQVGIESLSEPRTPKFGFLTACHNLVCKRCIKSVIIRKGRETHCRLCKSIQAAGNDHLQKFSAKDPLRNTTITEPSDHTIDHDFDEMDTSDDVDVDIPSSKISALLADIQCHPTGCKRCVGK